MDIPLQRLIEIWTQNIPPPAHRPSAFNQLVKVEKLQHGPVRGLVRWNQDKERYEFLIAEMHPNETLHFPESIPSSTIDLRKIQLYVKQIFGVSHIANVSEEQPPPQESGAIQLPASLAFLNPTLVTKS